MRCECRVCESRHGHRRPSFPLFQRLDNLRHRTMGTRLFLWPNRQTPDMQRVQLLSAMLRFVVPLRLIHSARQPSAVRRLGQLHPNQYGVLLVLRVLVLQVGIWMHQQRCPSCGRRLRPNQTMQFRLIAHCLQMGLRPSAPC